MYASNRVHVYTKLKFWTTENLIWNIKSPQPQEEKKIYLRCITVIFKCSTLDVYSAQQKKIQATCPNSSCCKTFKHIHISLSLWTGTISKKKNSMAQNH